MAIVSLRSLAASVAIVAGAACGGDDTAADSAVEGGDSAEVVMELVAFQPELVEIEVGATVTWTQLDAGEHTVTSGTTEQEGGGVTQQPDGRFESGELATGETFERTFDEPGTYPYYCSLHPATMRGEIRVT